MSSDEPPKPRAQRALRAHVSPLVMLLCVTICLLLLLLAQSPPSLVRELQPARDAHRNVAASSQHTASLAHTRSDWKYGADAEPCASIFEQLQQRGFLCGLYERPGSCTLPADWRAFSAKGVRMFSQVMQDSYVYIKHFTRLTRRGVYLDIASNHPIRLSNTYFYDRCLGWKGICVEANEKYHVPTYRERSCLLVPTCVGSTDGEVVKFRLQDGRGGVMGASYKYGNQSKGRVVKKTCTTVQAVLDRTATRHVDWMSLDVEGHELPVLRGIDFSRTRIDVITIEATQRLSEMRELLLRAGYEQHMVGEESKGSRLGRGFLEFDAIFVRSDVRFGYPT